MRLLRYRPRSVSEACDRLKRRGFSAEEIGATIRRAEKAGLLDDRLFAKLWITDRLLHRPASRKAIAAELLEKGIAPEVFEPLLDEAYPPARERKMAFQLAAERYARLAGLDPERRARRTANYLARRGFPRSLAISIVRRLEEESDE